MRSPSPTSGTPVEELSGSKLDDQNPAGARGSEPAAGDREQAAQGPIPVPVSAAANPAPSLLADSPAAAQGRRTLSTAFVMVGPDGHLTVELHDGHALVLRDVTMRAKNYCGVLVGRPSRSFCGTYADVAAARPGGAPPREAGPAEPAAGPERRPLPRE